MRYYLAKQTLVTEPDISYLRTKVGDHITRPDSWNDINASPWPRSQATGLMLTMADATDEEHAAIIADPDITYLPIENAQGNAVTGPLTNIPGSKRAEVMALLEAAHVPVNGTPALTQITEIIEYAIKRFLIRQILKEDDYSESLDSSSSTINPGKQSSIDAKLLGLGFAQTNTVGSVRQQIQGLIQDARWAP